jgi:hypothetical protein
MMRVLWMYVLKETHGGNGEGHEGAVLVSLNGDEEGAMWLPKSQIRRGGVSVDGKVEIRMPIWLAKENGLGEMPF